MVIDRSFIIEDAFMHFSTVCFRKFKYEKIFEESPPKTDLLIVTQGSHLCSPLQ